MIDEINFKSYKNVINQQIELLNGFSLSFNFNATITEDYIEIDVIVDNEETEYYYGEKQCIGSFVITQDGQYSEIDGTIDKTDDIIMRFDNGTTQSSQYMYSLCVTTDLPNAPIRTIEDCIKCMIANIDMMFDSGFYKIFRNKYIAEENLIIC